MSDWRAEMDRVRELARTKLKMGYTYRIDYGPGNPNNQRIHLRAIVDDHVVVYAWWHRRWQTWKYSTKTLYELGDILDRGNLKRIGPTREE